MLNYKLTAKGLNIFSKRIQCYTAMSIFKWFIKVDIRLAIIEGEELWNRSSAYIIFVRPETFWEPHFCNLHFLYKNMIINKLHINIWKLKYFERVFLTYRYPYLVAQRAFYKMDRLLYWCHYKGIDLYTKVLMII